MIRLGGMFFFFLNKSFMPITSRKLCKSVPDAVAGFQRVEPPYCRFVTSLPLK